MLSLLLINCPKLLLRGVVLPGVDVPGVPGCPFKGERMRGVPRGVDTRLTMLLMLFTTTPRAVGCWPDAAKGTGWWRGQHAA